MKNKTILVLLLVVSLWSVTANAAQSATTCDRECLRGKVTQLLHAFLKHDVSGLPVAGTLRVQMADGSTFDAGPGDVTAIPQGHDAWVVGDEPVVVVDWWGASNYAKA